MSRGRSIDVLRLAERIAAELESGRVDDVDMDDETVARVAAMLAPGVPVPCGMHSVEDRFRVTG